MKANLTQSVIDVLQSRPKLTIKNIMTICGVTAPTAKIIASKYDLNVVMDGRTYIPNDNYFKVWSNEMAYFLGFIAADGHVRPQNNLLMINILNSDRHIIESMKKALEYPGPLLDVNKKHGQKQVLLRMVSKEMIKDLAEMGFTGNKTYDFDWVKGIPDEYVHHFIRGMFDGDGSCYINKEKQSFMANIVGTYKLTENIKNYYNKQKGYNTGCLNRQGSIQILEFNGRYNALDFLNWIYKDSTPETRLERKYKLYLELRGEICKEEKAPNNSKITQSAADDIRAYYKQGETAKSISERLDISEHIVYDAIGNRTWKDKDYVPVRKHQDTILITFGGKTKSIRDWSDETGLPYSTIDRRYREFLSGKLKSIDEVLTVEKLPKVKTKQSDKDKAAHDLAFKLRTDYKNGLIGKALYEKWGVPKSRAMDILANRTCVESEIWWK